MSVIDDAIRRAAEALGIEHDWHPSGWVLEPITVARVDEITAALLLLVHSLPETLELCPDCPPSEGPILFETREDAREWCRQTNRVFRVIKRDSTTGKWGIWSAMPMAARRSGRETWLRWSDIKRTCNTCSPTVDGKRGEPTGWVPRSWGAVLLGAMPRPRGDGVEISCPRSCVSCSCDTNPETTEGPDYDCPHHGAVERTELPKRGWDCICQGWGMIVVGSTDDREALAVLADKLLGCGDPLGEWLALWLGAVPCRACEGARRIDAATGKPAHEGTGAYCRHCGCSGLELGAHRLFIAAALDLLAERTSSTKDPIQVAVPERRVPDLSDVPG